MGREKWQGGVRKHYTTEQCIETRAGTRVILDNPGKGLF